MTGIVTMIASGFLTWIAVASFAVCLASDSTPELCPDVCFCNTVSRIVYCSRRGLPSIPSTVPDDTVQLNLNGNQFENGVLHRVNFSRYAELEHLYLSECSIETIDVGAFVDLQNLRWLDISNNRLRVIEERTFRGLNLQHLFLNGNRNLVLRPGSFAGLATTGLYLHDCSLSRIQPEVLEPLNATMRYLWLNGNDLDRVDRNFGSIFSRLLHLRLGTNPLDCGCNAIWLKEFYDKHADTFKGSLPPSCLTPRHLKGKYFNELSLYDIRCRAPSFTTIDAHFHQDTVRLRCIATGQPAPILYWVRPTGNTTRFNPPSSNDEEVSVNEAVLNLHPLDDEDRRHVTGSYACTAHNEAGNVTITISVPWIPALAAYLSTPHRETPSLNVVTPRGAVNAPFEVDTTTRVRKNPTSVTQSGVQSRIQLLMSPAATRTPFSTTRWVGGTGLHVHNVTLIQPRRSGTGNERMFSVAELAWAVTCTHFSTLTICLLVILVFYTRRRHKRRQRSRKEGRRSNTSRGIYTNVNFGGTKPSFTCRTIPTAAESAYLNGGQTHHQTSRSCDVSMYPTVR